MTPLESVLLQASKSKLAFNEAAQVVADDKAKLATDEELKASAASAAKADITSAIAALTNELADLPGAPSA